MTREERIKKLEELRAEAEKQVLAYNTAMLEGDMDAMKKADTATEECVNEYTSVVRTMCFDECKESPDPMLKAVTMLTFVTIAVKDEEVGEEKTPVRSIIEKEKDIDLLKLHKHCGSIGADKNWNHIVQKMNFLLTARRATELGIDPKVVNDSFAMSDIAKEYDMGKNPASNTNLLKTLRTVISAMLGEEYASKATSHDVNYLLFVFSKRGKTALSINCANDRYFRKYLAEICHRIVTGKSYEIEFQKKKA